MGKIKQGILGGFSGKVGNVIGTSWKGISVVKVMPQSVANPQTTAQVNQRNALSFAVAFATQILANFIKPCWDRFAQGMSGYNDFISSNIALFTSQVPSNPAALIASKGKLSTAESFTFSITSANNATFSHTNGIAGAYDQDSDTQFVMAFVEETGKAFAVNTGLNRTVLGPTVINNFNLDAEVGNTVHAYLVFRSADGTKVSPAAYDSFVVTA